MASVKKLLPDVVVEAFRSTAELMAFSFRTLGALNGERDAPMPEGNTVVHLASALLQRGFAVYTQGSFSDQCREGDEKTGLSGRIDLIASGHNLSLVGEVKAFGKRRFDRVLEDSRRVAAYRPEADRRADETDPIRFWKESEHWGLIVVQSFTSDDINDLWSCQVKEPEKFSTVMARNIKDLKDHEKPAFEELAVFLRERGAETGKILVCNEEEKMWKGDYPLHLLWAAFPM